MKIAFCYNVKHNSPNIKLENQADLEFDSPVVIETIQKIIEDLGHTVLLIEADENAFEKLKRNKTNIEFVFNIAEGLRGDARESHIPIYCELLELPYSHSSPTTHAIGLDKTFTKMVLKAAGVKVPESLIVREKPKSKLTIKLPVIVKPNGEGSSKGVLDKCIVEKESDLIERIREISEDYTKEVLVEEYIDGREFTVSVIGDAEVLPILEQKFDFLPQGMHKIASFELKWLYEDSLKRLTDAYDCPAKLTAKELKKIEETTAFVYKTLNCLDCARLDFRMDKTGELYFIEINTLPGLNPDTKIISYFRISANAAGFSFADVIEKILNSGISRYPHLEKTKNPSRKIS